jgi:small-conductance mechanosensitive channel
MSFITRVKKWLSLNKLEVIHEQYLAVRDDINPRNAREREEFEFYTKEFQRYYRKTERLGTIRVILYIILYATLAVGVLNLLAQILPFLSFIAAFLELGGSLISSGIALALIFIITVRINVHLQRLQACLMPLIVMHQLNARRDTKRMLHRMSRVI